MISLITPPRTPFFKICYICVREFGSQTVPIHELQCVECLKRQKPRRPESVTTK
uniref:Uncharacterized protein n=1 Tax=Phasianus colchicus TaxID=9054 RepID=A0A669Q8J4_PHACC